MTRCRLLEKSACRLLFLPASYPNSARSRHLPDLPPHVDIGVHALGLRVATHLGTDTLHGLRLKGEHMSALRRLRNFWILWVTTIVLACFSNAVAQASYRVADLGILQHGGFGCTMAVNNHGVGFIQYGVLNASVQLVKGRVAINVDGLKFDLGTLGGPNSWMNGFAGINERGEAVGLAETNVPDPNGEDICGFGTHLTCSPFLWKDGRMKALPTLGGTNGPASPTNNSGQNAA